MLKFDLAYLLEKLYTLRKLLLILNVKKFKTRTKHILARLLLRCFQIIFFSFQSF